MYSTSKIFLPIAICALAAAQSSATQAETSSPSKRTQTVTMAAQLAALKGQATKMIAYRNITLIDGTDGNGLAHNMTILVEGDRIASIVKSAADSESIPDGAEIVDGSGWYATPGLIDSHVHVATIPAAAPSKALLRRYLYGGVTTVRDMAGDVRALADLARAALINEIESPDIKYSSLMAGPSFFEDPRTIGSALGAIAGQVPWMLAIDHDTDLSLAVAQARGTWATGIKIYADLPGDLVQAIIKEGHRQGIPVWTHAKIYPATPFDSIGADAVSHACMVAIHVLEQSSGETYGPENRPDMSQFSVDAPEFKRFVAAMSKSNTKFDVSMLIYAQAEEAAKTYRLANNGQEPPGRPVCPKESVTGPMVAALHAAGVKIIAGTDASSAPDDPFPALIEEMTLLASIEGFSKADAIRAATINAAEALGLADEIGSIEAGKYANIVFLAKNPLEDIANYRNIVLTIKRGHTFYRHDYKHQNIPPLPFPGEE